MIFNQNQIIMKPFYDLALNFFFLVLVEFVLLNLFLIICSLKMHLNEFLFRLLLQVLILICDFLFLTLNHLLMACALRTRVFKELQVVEVKEVFIIAHLKPIKYVLVLLKINQNQFLLILAFINDFIEAIMDQLLLLSSFDEQWFLRR